MMAINMKSNAKGEWGASRRVTFTFACQCCPMTVDNDTHIHTYTHAWVYVCVHCSSRQMTVEWQRANKTHVKNRTCNEQNKPQRQRERERYEARGAASTQASCMAFFSCSPSFSLSLSLSFVAWKFPQFAKKSKAAPIWANLRRICHPRCREQRERETKRERQRERARARVYCKSALA